MKYLKMSGLAAFAAVALTASVGVGTASATGGVLCENTTDHCSSKWVATVVESPHVAGAHMDFHLKSGTSFLTESTGGVFQNTCTGSTVTSEVERAGSTTEKAQGKVEASWLTWSGCGGHATTVTGGTLEVTGLGEGKGTVFATGLTVTTTIGGLHCFYTAGTTNDLGVFTPGSNHLDGTLVINAIVTKVDTATHDSDALCTATARWTATYTQTGSTPLYITEG